jgi:hypothetical protein
VAVPPEVSAVTTLGSAEVEDVCVHSEVDDSACALSPRVEVRLWIWPTAEISVWTDAAFCCSNVSGCSSTAMSDVMMPLTSSPLPMPAELIEPVALVVVVMEILGGSWRGYRQASPRIEARRARGKRFVGPETPRISVDRPGRAMRRRAAQASGSAPALAERACLFLRRSRARVAAPAARAISPGAA